MTHELHTLQQVQDEVFQTARDKGWWDDCSYRKQSGLSAGDPDCNESEIDRTGPVNVKLVEATIPEKLALIHSEITEAYDDLEASAMTTVASDSGKPVGFPTEIADVAIRCLDLAGAMGFSYKPEVDVFVKHPSWTIGKLTIGKFLLVLHKQTSECLETFRSHKSIDADLYRIVVFCYQLASAMEFDLDAEIIRKHTFNKTRPARHGGKRC